MELVNIGFGNVVSGDKVVAILNSDSSPIKRLIQDARDRQMLIDATYGRKTRSVVVTTSNHVVLSPVQAETIAQRTQSKEA
ncbi:MAG: DUF370 domain-containing protein [Tissierellia bacterium]|nr:DUF370 domain-containing protein [Tissierellia bacterium]